MAVDDDTPSEEADEIFGEWMRQNLDRAAEHFEVAVVGEPVFGWRLRSISAAVRSTSGPRWLRVVSEQLEWADGDWWTGNADSNAITGVRKPKVLGLVQWDVEQARRQRGELMTFVPGQRCSDTDVLRAELDLPADWWEQLRGTIDAVREVATERMRDDEPAMRRAVHDALGIDLRIEHWETVHGDLHWANLLRPRFGLLDWELWGRGPAGTDAASLYCYSLLTPGTAAQVWETFADVLEAPHGRTALRYAAARILHRVDMGDHPDLAEPLRELVANLPE
ncbi:MAG: aminoglycoside phosphotransferase [Saccharopolyspora sp.]|uniref:aminoglycoside phosphotransferase n=1 Tax=unclassified Saccharopolyspora TaxID=2646250 RepID=UPI0025FF79D7|nr:aminoglycoside phosphotransferase [Saccharopolyspora sp.]MBQ6640049.1 aminoglycoside phosphotransferase [Saccharopolyspora sp.]